ncbi:hypothetical protein K492DRAFT_175536 [Lichtheimia hyalospora FSU 10163]|nr:hypothetical protein K492DRAFT_175536 [Lichtheimia hyalospora FSU 10163]
MLDDEYLWQQQELISRKPCMVSWQQQKVHDREIELVQAKNVVEQSGKGSGRFPLDCTIIGCTLRMSLYQSVLPKGRRNVPQCFSTKCDHVARLNLLSHSKMQPL